MRAFALLRRGWPNLSATLVMIGSVRNAGDQAVVDDLRALGEELGLKEGRDYQLATNVSYAELLG